MKQVLKSKEYLDVPDEDFDISPDDILVTQDMITPENQFLAVEGVDCTGKGSITELIERKGLGIPGITVKRVDFPQYNLPSGAMIKSYLNGNYGDYSRLFSSVPGDSAVEWHAVATGRSERLIKDIRFIMLLYALNRIEYFKTTVIDPNTVYVFDRFSYSNIIHHLSALYSFYNSGVGEGLLQIEWRSKSTHKVVNFQEYKLDRIIGMLGSMYSEIYGFEGYNDVPFPYTFLLLLDEHQILERLENRKETKHEGEDILEHRNAIHRACEFLTGDIMDYHLGNGVVPLYIPAFDSNNEKIADMIISLYKTAVSNGVGPRELSDILADDDENDED